MEQGIDIYIPTALELNELKPQWPNYEPDRFWKEGGVTVSRVPRAKGNEADMVYVVGFDHVARNEADVSLRNQLFVALTRARGWVSLSGVGSYPMYEEMRRVIESEDTFTFTYKRPLKRDIGEGED
jgi:superfamily I DNA and RNA helicase